MKKQKLQCEDCGYFWEKNPAENFPLVCPVCLSGRIHRSTKHQRFAKKARTNLRRMLFIR